MKKFIFTLLIFLNANYLHASNQEKTYEGLELEKPVIRKALKDYILECDERDKILMLGEGHIMDPYSLPEEFSPGTGGQELTNSMVDGSYTFHKNEGFYTASAELAESFNSDWVGNFRIPSHRETLFFKNTYTIIFDATYHPGAQSDGLYVDIANSLLPEGYFIQSLPVTLNDEDRYISGHYTEETSDIDWYAHKVSFPTLGEVNKYWELFLIKRGFSEVSFFESPVTLFLNNLVSSEKISTSIWDKMNEQDRIFLDEIFLTPSGLLSSELHTLSKESEAAKINPAFAHYGLSTHYFIAKK